MPLITEGVLPPIRCVARFSFSPGFVLLIIEISNTSCPYPFRRSSHCDTDNNKPHNSYAAHGRVCCKEHRHRCHTMTVRSTESVGVIMIDSNNYHHNQTVTPLLVQYHVVPQTIVLGGQCSCHSKPLGNI